VSALRVFDDGLERRRIRCLERLRVRTALPAIDGRRNFNSRSRSIATTTRRADTLRSPGTDAIDEDLTLYDYVRL
jgi:hypothetical protein